MVKLILEMRFGFVRISYEDDTGVKKTLASYSQYTYITTYTTNIIASNDGEVYKLTLKIYGKTSYGPIIPEGAINASKEYELDITEIFGVITGGVIIIDQINVNINSIPPPPEPGPRPPTVTSTITVDNTIIQPQTQATKNVELTLVPICVHGDSIVKTKTGNKKIKDIRANDIVYDENNKEVIIINNIESIEAEDFIIIDKNAFGENKPSERLLITPQHPILVNGEIRESQTLVNNNNIIFKKLDPVKVYSLCTQEMTYVMINNIPVGTWGKKCYQERVDRNRFAYRLL